MTIFGPDASAVQGGVDWAQVDASCGFGWEKVTEGTGYVNPRWPTAKAAMAGRASVDASGVSPSVASGFVPGAYLFLHEGNGAAQASYFADKAGDLAGFAIAIDGEPTGTSRPREQDLDDCAGELRKLYPHHPIGGYLPEWYWGPGADLLDVDWLWASRYVNGSGKPADLYKLVQGSWWTAYGGRTVSLLQFTSSAKIAGVSGLVDCSAFGGTPTELAKLILPPPPPPKAYRHVADGTQSLDDIAASRHVALQHLIDVTRDHLSLLHLAEFDIYIARGTHRLMPRRMPYWTSRP